MSVITEPLILDLVEWVAASPRPYTQVMTAWRTSCPRLPVWEEAVERGLVVREHVAGQGAIVRVTPQGMVHLRRNDRLPKDLATSAAA